MLTFVSYQMGEILDDAVFDSWLRPLVDKYQPTMILIPRCRAWKRFGVWDGSYKASMALLKTAGGYDGGRVEWFNESAKFARGAAFLFILTPWMVDLQVLPVGAARGVGGLLGVAMLFVYAYLKPRHIGLLYERVYELADKSSLQHVDLDDGIRLFFWDGVMACSARQVPTPKSCQPVTP